MLVASIAFLLAACGSGGGSVNAAHQPVKRGESLTSVFDHLPRYPRSHSVASRTRNNNGTLVQSFLVSGTTPRKILDYYVDVLPRDGWTAAQRPAIEGTVDRRGSWNSNRRTLVVASAAAPTAGSSRQGDAKTQYSLLLYPAGVSAT